MARQPAKRRGLLERTPVAEWTAAAIGLVLTFGVIGYSLWEGLASGNGPPSLTVMAEPPEPAGRGHLVPIVVRNASHATAGAVEVRGVLETDGRIVEERRAIFTYVPGKGEARGGLLFERDPAAYVLRIAPEGYEEP